MSSSYHLSRRTFLQVALATLPAAALPGGELDWLWPESELDREVDDPWVLALDGEVLWDPAFDVGPRRVPTLRVYLDDRYPGIATAQGSELDALMKQYVAREMGLDEDSGEAWLDALDDLSFTLDKGLDTCSSEFENWIEGESNGEAWTTWMELPEKVREGFDIHLVEGDCPGYNRTYIRYTGCVDALNDDLAAAGLNIVVIDEEPSSGLLFPGAPGY
ncbi:MAG: hypothetical protein ACJA2W_001416 [Planctomycetota bacterium]|jgi:hypothetical protein